LKTSFGWESDLELEVSRSERERVYFGILRRMSKRKRNSTLASSLNLCGIRF